MRRLEKAALIVALDQVTKQKGVLALLAAQGMTRDAFMASIGQRLDALLADTSSAQRLDQAERLIVQFAVLFNDFKNEHRPQQLPVVLEDVELDAKDNDWLVFTYTNGKKKRIRLETGSKGAVLMRPNVVGGGNGNGNGRQEVFFVGEGESPPCVDYPALAFQCRDLSAFGYPISVARLQVNAVDG